MSSINKCQLISIIIPTFNREHVIKRTINSVLSQTYPHFECLIIDDFSTDETKNLILKYEKQDSRVQYIRNMRKKGSQGARNTGILNSKGEWIVFFDSDNYMHVEYLECLINKIIEQKADICTCFINIFDYQSKIRVGSSEFNCQASIHKTLLTGKCYVDFNNSIIKKNRLLQIGLLDEKCPSHQEKDTHIRLSKISVYTTVEKYLVDYYTGAPDAISSNFDKEIKGLLYLLKKYGFYWRLNCFRGFINSAKRTMGLINQSAASSAIHYKCKLFFYVPELLIFLLKNKAKSFWGGKKLCQ